MRPLFYDFPEDKKCWEVEIQYMYGKDILVAPVLYAKENQMEVYLPEGEKWVNIWNGNIYEGGQTVVVDTPMDQIPIFTREGSTLKIV